MTVRCYSSFLFDWDGCLADTLAIWHAIYRQLLRLRGIQADDRAIVRELFNDWAGPARFGIRDVQEFAAEVQRGLGERIAEVRLNPYAAETLHALNSRGARCAVVTASRRHLVAPVLEREGIAKSVELLLTMDEVPAYKPDPAIVFRALETLGVEPSATVLVGDSSKDLETADRAGIASALYFPKRNARFYDLRELRRYGPDHVIRDFRELPAMAADAPRGGETAGTEGGRTGGPRP
jgi:HAD superfamily hydrolase (TIGR01509 family)